MKYIFLINCIFISLVANADDTIVRSWNGIYQEIEAANIRGCHFKLSAFVKVSGNSSESKMHLFLIGKNARGWVKQQFSEQLQASINQDWTQVVVSGQIKNRISKLRIGILIENAGVYKIDSINLQFINNSGNWKSIEIENGNFNLELENSPWILFDNVRGFDFSVKSDSSRRGYSVLLIDGSDHYSFGKNPASGNFIKVNNIKLYYESYGQGKPLVLLHGNSQSIRNFENQIPVFSEYFNVIVVDTRGHGNSGINDDKLTYELFASDVEGLLLNLKLDSIYLLGWSDGGNTGLIMAMNNKINIEKLVLMGANLYNRRGSVKPLINVFLKVKRSKLRKAGQNTTIEYRLINLLLEEPNLEAENLKLVNAQTLVLAGANDVIKRKHTKLINKHLPNSKMIILENSNHLAPENNSRHFNKIVLDFLTGS